MLNMFLVLAVAFIFTIIVGKVLERFRMPWIFAALIFGVLLAVYNPFSDVTGSESFAFLAQLGMYFLLFIIGFEIDLKDMKKKGAFLLKSTFFIILFEAFFGTLLVYFVFGYGWLVSFLVALSFATVGEAILIPILDEFRMVRTRLGEAIIGIGVLDDIIEVAALVMVVAVVGTTTAEAGSVNIWLILGSLLALFVLTFTFSKLKEEGEKFNFLNIETLFIFSIFVLFLFLGIGQYAEATALAAFLAGIGLRTFVSKKRLRLIESEVKSVCYGFFAPIFFVWVGASLDISYLTSFPVMILLIVAVSMASKLIGSLLTARNSMPFRESIMLGIGLSVRFSTSIIIIKILFDSGLIGIELYSVVVASSIVFTFMIPMLFSWLLVRWKIARVPA
ncbi:MAG: cation:proton antiporter [Candidatus Aenigmarchaeota archaeon]|nr:cation:proton antiporter [Candidatus Aenigmarchaeota archaeon]